MLFSSMLVEVSFGVVDISSVEAMVRKFCELFEVLLSRNVVCELLESLLNT